jgi:LCP family protein required for cell wall assembly
MINLVMKKRKSKHKSLFINGLLLVSAVFLFGTSIYNRLFPVLVLNGLIILSILALLISFTKVHRFLKAILSVLLIIIGSLSFSVQYNLDKLLEKVEFETSTISVYVLKVSDISALTETSVLSIALSAQMDSELLTYFKEEVSKISATINYEITDNDITAFEMLRDGELEAIAVDNNVVDTILEIYPEFVMMTKSIFSIDKEHEIEDPIIIEEPKGDSFVVFISGIDTTGPITNRSRSDVNILMSVNLITGKIAMVSIPRDTYIDLVCKDGAKDKLTHAGRYGVGCSISTIENLVDVDINYYIKVNFTSFIKIVDVIGPIKVYSAYEFKGFTKGYNTLNATEALRFARERYSFPSGDVQRGLNQQQVIIGIINKLTQPASLAKTDKIVSAVSKSVETNVNSELIQRVVNNQLENNPNWVFETYHLKGIGDMQPTYSMGSRLLYVYWPNEESLIEIKAVLAHNLLIPSE